MKKIYVELWHGPWMSLAWRCHESCGFRLLLFESSPSTSLRELQTPPERISRVPTACSLRCPPYSSRRQIPVVPEFVSNQHPPMPFLPSGTTRRPPRWAARRVLCTPSARARHLRRRRASRQRPAARRGHRVQWSSTPRSPCRPGFFRALRVIKTRDTNKSEFIA